jgi:hypothetical protein
MIVRWTLQRNLLTKFLPWKWRQNVSLKRCYLFIQSTPCHDPEYSKFHSHRSDNFRSQADGIRFDVFTATSIKVTVLWAVTPCSLVVHRSSIGISRPRVPARTENQANKYEPTIRPALLSEAADSAFVRYFGIRLPGHTASSHIY